MLFSSPLFLFLFLPAVLLGNALASRGLRNIVLLLASLFFYAWGEPQLLGVMLLSIAGNYGFGLAVERLRGSRWQARMLAAAVVGNLGLLASFKYVGFLAANYNAIANRLGWPIVTVLDVALPIGISFYTFQALSYVIDVYRGQTRAQRNLIDMALYIALFPQLIAGPIVRYVGVAAQLRKRRTTLGGFAYGVRRFIVGLGKKMLIANGCATVADVLFAAPPEQLAALVAWLGIVCYALQLYYDFSGYSDMAIGLGRMFGFRFAENFRYPYAAASITEFWRRWHISLSTWFRDYLYIPLGGNRRGRLRTYANLLIVFLLCGLWHGAGWQFAVWGLFHGMFLVVERRGSGSFLNKLWSPLRHAYVVAVLLVGWVFFRAENVDQALRYLTAMAGLNASPSQEFPLTLYLGRGLAFTLLIAGVGSTPFVPWVQGRLRRRMRNLRDLGQSLAWQGRLGLTQTAMLAVVFSLSVSLMLASTYNPFIYFRF